MKRLVLAMIILAGGTAAFFALRDAAAESRRQLVVQSEEWTTQSQQVAHARSQHAELADRVDGLKRDVRRQGRGRFVDTELAAMLEAGEAFQMPTEIRERLFEELDLNWHTSGAHLVVSKEALRNIGLTAIRDGRLTDTLCGVLAVTPEERARVESAVQRVEAEFALWTQAHAERVEPAGDVVAQYVIPASTDLSLSLSNTFSTAVTTALGPERGELLSQYALQWGTHLGMSGADNPTTLTVRRQLSGDEPRLMVDLRQGYGSMSYGLSPGQTFPRAFHPLFPGGWAELAEREGFQLPETFSTEKSP